MNPNRPISRHIIIKMMKVKERILKTVREKQSVMREIPVRLLADFSTEALHKKKKKRSFARQKEVAQYIQS